MTWLTPDPGGHPAERLRALLAAEQTLIVPGVFHGLSALLARRAGIDQDDAWRLFSGGDAMLLARLAGCERATADQILAAFEPMSGAVDRFIDRFDGMDDAAIERQRQWLRLDPHYRAAREALDRGNG